MYWSDHGQPIRPSRTEGNTRLYSDRDLEQLELILHLTRDLGVNLAGVEVILHMRTRMESMQQGIEEVFAYLTEYFGQRTSETGGAANELAPLPLAGLLRLGRRVLLEEE